MQGGAPVTTAAPLYFSGPHSDCALCPRLEKFRHENRRALPRGFNAPVPAFGSLDAELLIVGLAPGLHGANRTGRPFTGDWAGDMLYPALLRFGFAQGEYCERADDGLRLRQCRISNAVRCVPPQNKPTTAEISACRAFLAEEIAAMPNLRALLCLGRVAHDSVIRLFGERAKAFPFAHGAKHFLESHGPESRDLALYDSYHCSRYNTNTGVLTTEMFDAVFAQIAADLRKSLP
jgi:uracil-DNA glycosylase family 4